MPNDAFTAQLGAAAPDGLRELSDDELRDLGAAVADARHRQAAALAQAGDRARAGDRVAAALDTMDDETVLRVAFVLEDKDQLSRLLDGLSSARSAGIIAAAARAGLWLEALDLLNHLSESQRAEMVTATLDLDEASHEGILDTIIEHDLADEAVLIAKHDDTIQERLDRRQAQR